MGRTIEAIHEDIGTIGEARASRKLVEFEGVEVLLNVAHEYDFYRDWLTGFVANNNRPAMPSVHGGAIAREIGGRPEEPLFRGSPMDTAQSVAAVIQTINAGAESVVVIATQSELADGHQLQKNATIDAATQSGLTILEVLDVQPQLSSYTNALAAIPDLNPDAIIVATSALDGGTIVNNLAEMGVSTTIIGTTEWQNPEFLAAASPDAINQHEAVWLVTFAHAESPAWDYLETMWNESAYANLSSPDNSYLLQFYDLLTVTALAIEAAGTTEADVWSEYVPRVAQSPGTVVYSYAEGIEALRNGEEIDYSGVTGDMIYTETGVVSGLFAISSWTASGELEQVQLLDDEQILALDS